MSLVVEDGTGLPTAESYLSVADLDTYVSNRGLTNAAATTPAKEAALRNATTFIDSFARYKGVRYSETQGLEFPRTGLTDWSGYTVSGIPNRLKNACAELAVKAASESLYTDADRGGMVKSESVGPISTTYMDGAPPEKLFTIAKRLLDQYIRKVNELMGGPFMGGWDGANPRTPDNVGYFQLDGMSNSEDTSTATE